MNEIPQISNAEWEIMQVIWQQAPVRSVDVIRTLEDTKDWKPKTIKTLIRRLLDKGVISYTTEGNAYVYHVEIEETAYIDKETNNFLSKIYNGSISRLMLNFVKDKKLSNDEISELIKILKDSKN